MKTRRGTLKLSTLVGIGCMMPDPFRTLLGASTEAVDFNTFFELALAAGRKEIIVPKGTYRVVRSLRIPSGTKIIADAEAVITRGDGAATRPEDYLLTNARSPAGDT